MFNCIIMFVTIGNTPLNVDEKSTELVIYDMESVW